MLDALRLLLLLLIPAWQPHAAAAMELAEAWRAATRSEREYALARAAHSAAQPRREQAAALWRPSVGMDRSCLREAGLPGHHFSVDFRAGSAPFEIFRRGLGPMFTKRGAADRKERGLGDRR